MDQNQNGLSATLYILYQHFCGHQASRNFLCYNLPLSVRWTTTSQALFAETKQLTVGANLKRSWERELTWGCGMQPHLSSFWSGSTSWKPGMVEDILQGNVIRPTKTMARAKGVVGSSTGSQDSLKKFMTKDFNWRNWTGDSILKGNIYSSYIPLWVHLQSSGEYFWAHRYGDNGDYLKIQT